MKVIRQSPHPWAWRGFSIGAAAFSALAALILWVMNILADRATRATWRACEVNPASAQWTKGYPFIVPVCSLIALLFAVVLALTALIVVRRSPIWTKVVSASALCAAILLLFPITWRIEEYDDYPGADISTLNAPCPQ
ncbi:hypothetical protein [Actinomadura macra]|uniref:hypothetical protein n=1 Tax=Actinomadura macra TaxID=46164 RepID=UPI0014721F21|nr:hypothetical protein [Actinomadura macra]